MIFGETLLHVILPIFLIIGVGVVMDRKFRLDLPTLSKLNFYVLVPALIFIKILEAGVDGPGMLRVGGFAVVHAAIMLALSLAVFSLGAFRQRRVVLSMAAIFYNAGNFGIPFVVLAFDESYIGPLAVVLMTQNFLTFTLGVWMMRKGGQSPAAVLLGLLKLPVVDAVVIALLMRWLNVGLPSFVQEPIRYLGDGLVPVALLTLGVQLSRSRIAANGLPVGAAALMRLAVSPVLAALLARAFGFSSAMCVFLTVIAGFPVAVNVYILAAEYRRGEELASQAIFWTTLLSAATLSLFLAVLG